MNDILSNEPPPAIIRSRSDASEFARRSNPFSYGSLASNHRAGDRFISFGVSSPPGLVSRNVYLASAAISSSFASATAASSMSNNHGSGGGDLLSTTVNTTSNANSATEDEDFDLNMVFDEIGALQNKGLDEATDDTSTAPLITTPSSSTKSAHHQQQQQHHSPTNTTTTTTTVANTNGVGVVVDETELSLANEKYQLNIR